MDDYHDTIISLAIVSAFLCAIMLPIVGIWKLVQWLLLS